MSAIKRLKAELEATPLVPGSPVPFTFASGPGAFPIGVSRVILELIERVEALEALVERDARD